MKKILNCLGLAIFVPVGLYAQPNLTKSCNLMRHGDHLIKQQVEYKTPGREGEHVLWDFSQQKPINENYGLTYYKYDDSLITGQEHQTLYKYLLKGDSLFSCGFENQTTLIRYAKPELQLVYPMLYGNRHEDYFYGNGDYCNHLFISTGGKSVIQADAYGVILLPSGDTLRHVLRTHQIQKFIQRTVPYRLVEASDTVFYTDSIDYHLANDTVYMQLDTYRWYADGYRYPIFETIQSTAYTRQKPYPISNTAFYYTPDDQYYDLENDPENQAKREEEAARQEALNYAQTDKNKDDTATDDSNPIDYNAYLTDNGNSIILEYSLNKEADISIMLFDMQSRQLSNEHRGKQPEGFYQANIPLYGFQPGEYTLRIVVDNKIFGVKIIK